MFYRTSVADFVFRELQAAWNLIPNGVQYEAWVARVIADPTLESGGVSQALASTPQFPAQYGVNGTTNATLAMVQTFAADLLGIQPAIWAPALWVFRSGGASELCAVAAVHRSHGPSDRYFPKRSA